MLPELQRRGAGSSFKVLKSELQAAPLEGLHLSGSSAAMDTPPEGRRGCHCKLRVVLLFRSMGDVVFSGGVVFSGDTVFR
jgi:hypothetical protein